MDYHYHYLNVMDCYYPRRHCCQIFQETAESLDHGQDYYYPIHRHHHHEQVIYYYPNSIYPELVMHRPIWKNQLNFVLVIYPMNHHYLPVRVSIHPISI